MLSSISSSKPLKSERSNAEAAIWILLAGLLALAVLAELSASVGLARISRIQKRIVAEAEEALHIRDTVPGARISMLLAGNSLLLEGVDFPELKRLVGDRYDAHRFIIEQTHYQDWYFGLKRLLRHGSRPREIVLALSVGELLADTTRGEFAARHAMDVQDVWEAARRGHLDATASSNLFLAHYSGWLGTRAEIRKWILGRILPDAAGLVSVLGFRPAPAFSPTLERSVAPARFRELRALCDAYGATLSILVPPVAEPEDGSALLSEIGHETGVRVLVPVKPAEFSKGLFRDGFHLSASGAARFTPKLAVALVERP